MKPLTIFLAALLTSLSAAAQQPMTLKECLEKGLETNYDIRIVQGRQAVSDNNATAANAGMLPSVGLSAGYSASLEDRTSVQTTGEKSADRNIFDQGFNAGVSLDWTLFDGLRIRTNLKRLRELQQAGRTQTRIQIENFIASFTAEYYNYIRQTLRLNNFRYAAALSRERLRITEERFKIGDFSRLDLLQARVDFNADSSQYMSQQELVTASRIRINELLANEDLTGHFTVADSVIDVNSSLVWDSLFVQTENSNAQLLMADHDRQLSELELRQVQSRNYPYLNLSAGYGYSFNRYGSGTVSERGVLGPNASLRLGFTIFDGNRIREQRNARIEIENARLAREQVRQSLLADLSNFWQAYQNNLHVIELERQNVVAARQNYEIAMERYLLGDLPGIEMREAQKSLLDAEERILAAEYNTKLCEISLQQISGNIAVYLE